MTVEGQHEYFAGGYLVSNCMDSIRYALYTEWFRKEGPRLSADDHERMRREVQGDQDGPKHGKFFDDRMW